MCARLWAVLLLAAAASAKPSGFLGVDAALREPELEGAGLVLTQTSAELSRPSGAAAARPRLAQAAQHAEVPGAAEAHAAPVAAPGASEKRASAAAALGEAEAGAAPVAVEGEATVPAERVAAPARAEERAGAAALSEADVRAAPVATPGRADVYTSHVTAPGHATAEPGPDERWSSRLQRLLLVSPLSCMVTAAKRLQTSELGKQHAAVLAAVRQRLGSMPDSPVAGVEPICVMMIGLFFSLALLVMLWSSIWEKSSPEDVFDTHGEWPHAHVPGIYSMPVLPAGVSELYMSRSAMRDALQGRGKVHVIGPNRKPLLSLWLEGRFWNGAQWTTGAVPDFGAPPPWLEIQALTTPNIEPICIGPLRTHSLHGGQLPRRKAPLEIHLPGGGVFGEMLPHNQGWCLVHKGTTVLVINCQQPFPHLTAMAMDGRIVAAMSVENRAPVQPSTPPGAAQGLAANLLGTPKSPFGGEAAPGAMLPPSPEEHLCIRVDQYADCFLPFACLLAASMMQSAM